MATRPQHLLATGPTNGTWGLGSKNNGPKTLPMNQLYPRDKQLRLLCLECHQLPEPSSLTWPTLSQIYLRGESYLPPDLLSALLGDTTLFIDLTPQPHRREAKNRT